MSKKLVINLLKSSHTNTMHIQAHSCVLVHAVRKYKYLISSSNYSQFKLQRLDESDLDNILHEDDDDMENEATFRRITLG